ncbi:MAG: alanine--tRNA ligase, partial [Chitinophagaceae bacterium]
IWTAEEIRKKFLTFFQGKGHHIVPSSPIVIKNDPTLLFTNAGMNPFKDIFLGNRRPEFTRVADTQKCLRVSGKHNDLEEVGIDTYHHTMFEMLGNWSFGDYFKEEAIAWSWELLTEVFQIPGDRLYVTVFGGDDQENLPNDEHSFHCWKKHIPAERILLGSRKDNFWEMGETGPCGPCTEIHVDCRDAAQRAAIDGKSLVNSSDPQVIEIWNNVFMEFNRMKDGHLEPLPERHVDTGMGLERLVRVLQNKNSNYDTDLFTPLILEMENLCGKKYEAGGSQKDIAFRVIADHIRAICFTISDGQLPANTGAGYVIRRILRRAVRYYFSFLEVKKPVLFELVPVLAAQFKGIFPELLQQAAFVSKVIREEEEAFLRTLEKGMGRFHQYVETDQMARKEKRMDGNFAFSLYDTYGFPVDLTLLMAREIGWTLDERGFSEAMNTQKNRSRAATEMNWEDWVILHEVPEKFVGYQKLEAESRLLRYRKVKSKGKEQFQLILDQTPFYAESGGQVGDSGKLDFGGEIILVKDTKKENGLTLHWVNQLPVHLQTPIRATVDAGRRKKISGHHSATHLLHAALRKILGSHVQQKGSLVNEENLRFDFSHFSKVTESELEQIEILVNEKIRENIPVVIRELPREEALESGAMALFGEKYGNLVRVVTIDPSFSLELCGGTHVTATGELGYFKILSETAVSAGVRRIEAVMGQQAEEFLRHQMHTLSILKTLLKHPKDLVKGMEQILAEKTDLEKKLEQLETRRWLSMTRELLPQVIQIGEVNFLGVIIEADHPDSLKQIAFQLRTCLKNYLLVLAAEIEGKAHVLVMIEEHLSKTRDWDASKIIREWVAPMIQGGGGGQKTMATAGGAETENLQAVITKLKSLVLF